MMASINGCPPYADHYALACNMIAVAGANAATLRGLTFTQFDVAAQETSLTSGNWKYNSGDLKNLTCTDGTNYYSIWQCYPEGLLTYDLYVFRYEYVFDQQSGTWFWQYDYSLVYANARDSFQLLCAMRGHWCMIDNESRVRLDDGTIVQLPANYNRVPVEYRPGYGWIFTATPSHAADQLYLYTTGYGEITQSKNVQYWGHEYTLGGNTPVGLFDDGSFLWLDRDLSVPRLLKTYSGYAIDVGYWFGRAQFGPNQHWIFVGDTACGYTVTSSLYFQSTIEVYGLQHVFNGTCLNADTTNSYDLVTQFNDWLNSHAYSVIWDGARIPSLFNGDVPCSFMRLILHNASWTFHQPMMQCIAANYNGAAQRGYWYGTAVDQTGTPYRHVVLSAYVNGIEGLHQPFNEKFEVWSFNESGGKDKWLGFYAPGILMEMPDVYGNLNLPSFMDSYSMKGTPITTAYETQLSIKLLGMLYNMGIGMQDYRSWWTDEDLKARLLGDPLEAIYNGLGDWLSTGIVRMFTKVDYQNKFIREITL